MYAIFDWANNRLTRYGTFKTFNDAWSLVYDVFPEEDWQDLFVEEVPA